MARERYLLNAGEDTIHTGEIKLETGKQKRQNWWFYHKVHLIGGILLAAVVFSIIYSIASKVHPDYDIALVTAFPMPDSGVSELERCIAEYADDRNGDGRVVVSVVSYTLSPTAGNNSATAQQQEAALTRFVADCSTNESMIFLHDEAAFNYMKLNFGGFFQYNDGTPMPEEAKDFENAMIPWEDMAAFFGFVPVTTEDDSFTPELLLELYQRLRFSVRTSVGSSIESKEKDMEYYRDSLALYERLKSGEKLPAGEEQ